MPGDATYLSAAPTPEDLFRYDPARKPDSRYRRVLELINHRPRPLRCKVWDDQPVCDMRNYLLGQRARSKRQRKLLASQLPAQAAALQIFERADPELRLHLECRILAGQSDAEIAYRLGLTRETVATFEQLFFCIRDRLTCLDWIHTTVLDSGCGNGLPVFERLMKARAFAAGPNGIDRLLTGDPARRDRDRRAGALIDKFNAAVANEFTATQRAELDRFIQAEQHAEIAAAATRNAIAASVRQTLVDFGNPGRDQQHGQPCLGAESVDARSAG